MKKLVLLYQYGTLVLTFDGVINSLNDLNISKLTNELNRQSLMIGYIDAFKLYSWVGFLSIPLIFLIKITKTQNN